MGLWLGLGVYRQNLCSEELGKLGGDLVLPRQEEPLYLPGAYLRSDLWFKLPWREAGPPIQEEPLYLLRPYLRSDLGFRI